MTITVTPPPNTPPTAAVSATPISGYAPLSVSFSSSGSSDSDGTIAAYSWNFGDGGTSNSENPWHAYTSAGNFTATLTVTDDRGATGSKSITIAVSNNPSLTLHVADISMSKVVSRPGTSARAAVTIKGATGAVVPGVLVTGRWSGLVTGTSTLTTGPDGVATFASKATKKSGTFTFTVTGVSKSGHTYDPSDNAATSASIPK